MTSSIRQVLDEARAVFGQHPHLAETATVARAELGPGMHVRIRAGRYTLDADEPRAAGGGGTAPSPVQYTLSALAACTAITYRYWSELLGITLGTVEIEVRGDADLRGFLGFDPGRSPGLGAIQVGVLVTGPEGEERYRELHSAVEAHCPVLSTLARATPVTTSLTIARR